MNPNVLLIASYKDLSTKLQNIYLFQQYEKLQFPQMSSCFVIIIKNFFERMEIRHNLYRAFSATQWNWKIASVKWMKNGPHSNLIMKNILMCLFLFLYTYIYFFLLHNISSPFVEVKWNSVDSPKCECE